MARPEDKVMAQLKCIYTNARSMGNKQEELEAIVRQAAYDLVAITETWGDQSHDWSAAMPGYKLFRRDRQHRRGGGVALCIRESFDVVELEAGNDKVESLWVRIGTDNKASVLVRVCYRPLNQDEETDEEFYRQLTEVAKSSAALVLVGDFNFPDISWKHNTAQRSSLGGFWRAWKIAS